MSPEQDRLAALVAADPEVRARLPRPEVAQAVREGDGTLAGVVETVMLGYADRPALAERPVARDTDGVWRREPRHEAVTYGELWRRARSVSTAWRGSTTGGVGPGDVVASLGPPGVDHTVLELAIVATGAVSVPLAPAAPVPPWTSVLASLPMRALAVDVELLGPVLDALPAEGLPPTLLVLGPPGAEQRVARAVADAAAALAATGTAVHALADLDRAGQALPVASLPGPGSGPAPLAQILYTSGTTGEPKGAMFPADVLARNWRDAAQNPRPGIVVHLAPTNHIAARIALTGALARGGTCCFAGSGDMSTLLEDFALVRPTELSVVPRVLEILRERFVSDVEGRVAAGSEPEHAREAARADLRDRVLGGRVVSAANGSALLGDELRAFMTAVLGFPLRDGFGTTEAGGPILVDNRILASHVLDHKLVDVPELGYFGTDRPHPRGELLVRTHSMISGYYGRPDLTAELFDAEGFYRTGDVMARTGPDELRFVDRRNSVIKLAQAEFVSPATIEDALVESPAIDQILVHGRSGRAHLVAVVVPSRRAREAHPDPVALRAALTDAVRTRAAEAGLRAYEVPRALLVEEEPFSVANGLVSELVKLRRAAVRERYAERLDALDDALVREQESELAAARREAADRPVTETVLRLAGALVGDGAAPDPARRFVDLGGDSLAALGFSTALGEAFGVEVPVSVITGPTTTLGDVVALVERDTTTTARAARPTARSVHTTAGELRADDLATDLLLPASTTAPTAPTTPTTGATPPRTVLLTGATGFLGRALALELLRRPDRTVICLVRGHDAATARRRLEASFDTGDPGLVEHVRSLAGNRLEVLDGDVDAPLLGLDHDTWHRLAERVDAIVHPAAHVNHLLPYDQLFGPNVRGTAEVVALALATRRKEVVFTSTVGIADQVPGALGEDDDIRSSNPTRVASSSYAAGYATSKWAGEVLLRHAHERHDLPVTVVRSGLILADRRRTGQVNLPDTLTRLLLSVLLTGLAPRSFGQDPSSGRRPTPIGGLPVDFLARIVVGVADTGHDGAGFRTLNAVDPDPDGPTLDTAVDWLAACGVAVTRIDDHAEWLRRFEIGLRAVPEPVATRTALPVLDAFRRADPATAAPPPPATDRFTAAARAAGVDAVPGLTPTLVAKYVSDLAALGLVREPARPAGSDG